MSEPLSLRAARHLHLYAQGLFARPRARARKADVLAAIRRMALLQIDSISVVARSPYLVLWSRLSDYDPRWLDELLHEGHLFEYWAHEACFIPIEDYPLLRHRMRDPASMGWKYSARWMQTHAREIAAVKEHIRVNGPLRSADFVSERTQKSNGWWDWKAEKRHLEVLLTAGELMVRERRNFQRVYDLRERVLPDWDDARDLPPLAEAQDALRTRACRALGVVTVPWLRDYYRQKPGGERALVHALADQGTLLPVRIEGLREEAFVHANLGAELARAETLRSAHCTLLSPFDPLVWDRRRGRELWHFDYRIECYTPAAKRRYGYFTLPILWRGQLVGRLDAKAHRSDGVFEIKALHLEDRVRPSERLRHDLVRAISRCARWHGTPTVRVTQSAITLAFPAAPETPGAAAGSPK